MILFTRKMSIVRTPGTMDKPMIRIANRFLSDAGLKIGDAIEVSYSRGIITVKKLQKNEYNNIQEKHSISYLSIASDTEAF